MRISNSQSQPNFKGKFSVRINTCSENYLALENIITKSIKRECFKRSLPVHICLADYRHHCKFLPIVTGKADLAELCEKGKPEKGFIDRNPIYDAEDLIEMINKNLFDYQEGKTYPYPHKPGIYPKCRGLLYSALLKIFCGSLSHH